MNLTQEQIVKLIADAFRVGRAEGLEVGQKDGYADGLLDGDAEGYERGYEEGWDKGWEKGYDSGEADAEGRDSEDEEDEEEAGFESGSDKEDYQCQCPQCTNSPDYSMGWSDGYVGSDVDPDMKENEAYMDGFLQGRDDRQTEPDAV